MVPGMKVKSIPALVLLLGVSTAGANEAWFPGGWEANPTMLGSPARIELVLQPNGSFVMQTATPLMLLTTMGTYRVFPGEGVLRLDIENWEPRQTCFQPGGCQDIAMPDGETHRYRFDSQNTLILQDTLGLMPPIVYRRTL